MNVYQYTNHFIIPHAHIYAKKCCAYASEHVLHKGTCTYQKNSPFRYFFLLFPLETSVDSRFISRYIYFNIYVIHTSYKYMYICIYINIYWTWLRKRTYQPGEMSNVGPGETHHRFFSGKIAISFVQVETNWTDMYICLYMY